MGFFAGAGSWLVAAGRAIIMGLLNGLKAAAQAVLDYIAHLAAQVKAGFNAAIHAHSPSRDFWDIAEGNIGGGLLRGLDAVAPQLVAKIRELAQRMSATAKVNANVNTDGVAIPDEVTRVLSALGITSGPLNVGRGAASVVNNIHNEVHPAPGQSLTAIAAEVSREQEFRLRTGQSSLVGGSSV